MSNKEINPDVKKAIWKVVLYAVTVFASLFAGNVTAKSFNLSLNPNSDYYYVQQEVKSDSVRQDG